jgi:hypothetical protein
MEEPVNHLFPSQLGRVKEFGDDTDPYWFPSSEDGRLSPEPGEQILWAGSLGRLEIPGFPACEDGRIFVTDRRIAFTSLSFDKGNTYVGIGGVGLAIALGSTLVSQQNAKRRRKGKVLLSHIRYEWLTGMRLRRFKWVGGPSSYLDITARTSSDAATVTARVTPALTHDWINWVTQVVAHHRFNSGVDLGTGSSILERARAGDFDTLVNVVPSDHTWAFPGASDHMVRAIYQRDFA